MVPTARLPRLTRSAHYAEMTADLGIDTHLHALRHYSATALITVASMSALLLSGWGTAAAKRRPLGSTQHGWRLPASRPPDFSAVLGHRNGDGRRTQWLLSLCVLFRLAEAGDGEGD
jgi:hypothetical protein